MIKRIYRFIRYNEHKIITLQAWMYSAIYRFQILYKKSDKLKDKWGIRGEESPADEGIESYRYAKKVAYAVNQVCNKTKWESKCLVRALVAQRLLKKKEISSTMYLGCGLDEKGAMIAHAWLRCGKMYVTGGNGKEYATVEKFRM